MSGRADASFGNDPYWSLTAPDRVALEIAAPDATSESDSRGAEKVTLTTFSNRYHTAGIVDRIYQQGWPLQLWNSTPECRIIISRDQPPFSLLLFEIHPIF